MQTAFTRLFHRSWSGPPTKWGSFFSQCIRVLNSGRGKNINLVADFQIDRSLKLQGDKHLLKHNRGPKFDGSAKLTSEIRVSIALGGPFRVIFGLGSFGGYFMETYSR